MHSAELNVHLQGERPKVSVLNYDSFSTVTISFDKYAVKLFLQTEQDLVNFKNGLLWAFEKSIKM